MDILIRRGKGNADDAMTILHQILKLGTHIMTALVDFNTIMYIIYIYIYIK